jgi:hypothetical protein
MLKGDMLSHGVSPILPNLGDFGETSVFSLSMRSARKYQNMLEATEQFILNVNDHQ